MKVKTLAQVEAMQKKAIRFAENVLDNSDLADEIAELSPEEYAERKKVRLVENPQGGKQGMSQPTRAELMERIEELEELLQDRENRLQQIIDTAAPDEEDEAEDDEDEEEDDEDEEYE